MAPSSTTSAAHPSAAAGVDGVARAGIVFAAAAGSVFGDDIEVPDPTNPTPPPPNPPDPGWRADVGPVHQRQRAGDVR